MARRSWQPPSDDGRPGRLECRFLAVLLVLLPGACGHQGRHETGAAPVASQPSARVVLGPRPPMSKGAFPCTDCHEPDIPVKVTRRELKKAHAEIVLEHGGPTLWCWECHDVKSRDSLKAASGALISYDDAHQLCGQCHGKVLREWQAGAHGRRSGWFDGEATMLRCANCHDAHAPRFKPLTPATAPSRPRRTP